MGGPSLHAAQVAAFGECRATATASRPPPPASPASRRCQTRLGHDRGADSSSSTGPWRRSATQPLAWVITYAVVMGTMNWLARARYWSATLWAGSARCRTYNWGVFPGYASG